MSNGTANSAGKGALDVVGEIVVGLLAGSGQNILLAHGGQLLSNKLLRHHEALDSFHLGDDV